MTVSKVNERSMADWKEKFIDATADITSDCDYKQSADFLRKLTKTGLLRFTDIHHNPARFFEAHRLLLAPGKRGPGFGIRFTVQFNLFAGSVLGLGNEEQRKLLDKFQEEGRLGCFCLTETHAGVNSGLVVGTTCTWDESKNNFVLHCPDAGAEKNWISQGLTASKAVVIADLIVKGKHYGPHGFLVDLRESEGGKAMPGITMTDMGKKTTGNDLDNARIKFDNVLLERSSLLARFAEIGPNGEYVQTTKEKMRLEVIGQRLLTGRAAIAQAGLVFTQKLYEDTANFAKSRQVWAPKGAKDTYLMDLPQLKSLFYEADVTLGKLFEYTTAVEKELSEVLLEYAIPSAELVERIAVAKVACIETSIQLCFKLKQEVGSYGLMDKTGFEHIDFLQCCKFAEGDTRILGQKLARDTMKSFSQGKVTDQKVLAACNALASGLSEGGKDKITAWNNNWKLVYGVSNAVIAMHITNTVGEQKVLSLAKL